MASPGWCQPSPAGSSVVARAGNVFISEEEFLQRYELLPAFGRHRTSKANADKFELLYSLVAEKLLAQQGVEWGIESNPGFRADVEEIRKLLARDELYREEIVRKVSIPSAELHQGIACAQVELFVRYIYLPLRKDALFIRTLVKRPADFRTLRIDSSYHAIQDTATVIWGDADPEVEQAAYSLRVGQISPVIEAGSGYYILTLVSRSRNAFYSGMTADVLHERVETAIRRRRERARLDAFVAEVLKDKVGYARREPMRRLAAGVRRALSDVDRDSIVVLLPSRAAIARKICADALEDTIAIAGTRVWRLSEVLNLLERKSFGVPRDRLSEIPGRLNVEVEVLVQQELLAQEALRRKLDQVTDVRDQIAMWSQYFLAEGVKDSLTRSVVVSDDEVWKQMRTQNPNASIPQVQLRLLVTRTLMDMKDALGDLDRGDSLAGVIRRWSIDTSTSSRGGLTGFIHVTDRYPLGEMAESLEVGQRFGPVRTEMGIGYGEVVGKRFSPDARDTSFARRFAEARAQVSIAKARRKITVSLSGLAKRLGYAVYRDRVSMLKVTSTPMMTFRILGFGGRMFAVPFVDPQLDWLGVENPERQVMP